MSNLTIILHSIVSLMARLSAITKSDTNSISEYTVSESRGSGISVDQNLAIVPSTGDILVITHNLDL